MDGQAKPFALTLKVGSDRMSAESCHQANNGKQLSGLQGGPQTHEFGQFERQEGKDGITVYKKIFETRNILQIIPS